MGRWYRCLIFPLVGLWSDGRHPGPGYSPPLSTAEHNMDGAWDPEDTVEHAETFFFSNIQIYLAL